MNFLPTNKKEIKNKGLKQVDFVIVTGDAYVDHPSFGTSLIARYLESFNYTCAILAQPNFNDDHSIMQCGCPRLAFLVSSGNIDSIVNNYYTSKQKRKQDVYSLNNKGHKRPDYATSVYTKMIRKTYGDIPIIIGGIEASLRRLAHYDFLQDKLLPSILLTSSADLLVYGMGERAIIEIADYLNSGLNIKDLTFIKGTAYQTKDISLLDDYLMLPSFSAIKKDKKSFQDSFIKQYHNNENQSAHMLIEPYQDTYIVQNIPQPILNTIELDHLYDLNFTYESYDEYHHKGTITALKEIKFSININRGCNGGCHFCAITFHQGKQISMRSKASCLKEAQKMQSLKDFKGYIHDVGGPTANFNDEMCAKLNKYGSCSDKECLGFKICPNLKITHEKYFDILRSLRTLNGIKKVFVRSGIRYDYLLKDDPKYIEELIKYHISGQLRLAPEHCANHVLRLMNKPSISYYDKFVEIYHKINQQLGLKQFVVPYLMSSHPGSRIEDAIALMNYLKKINYKPLQVSDFMPSPSTLSTLMYYTQIDPFTNKNIYVAKSSEEKRTQQALLQYHLPKNQKIIQEILSKYPVYKKIK
ncbi:MAG: YgiQ family radical SAM protein [Bacilli bacterium]|jgi:uncharacterized radical SAM protein YgiQ|nr:YgiQ family radical SAM protein [Bacilli bacterium]